MAFGYKWETHEDTIDDEAKKKSLNKFKHNFNNHAYSLLYWV